MENVANAIVSVHLPLQCVKLSHKGYRVIVEAVNRNVSIIFVLQTTHRLVWMCGGLVVGTKHERPEVTA